jgi:DNA-binding beta-propeller fold protein YncE
MIQRRIWLLMTALASLGGCREGTPAVDATPSAGALYAPQGIAATSRYLVVASSGFHFVDGKSDWAPGSVAVIERATRRVVGRVSTSALNPQRVAARGDVAYIVCGGTVKMTDGLATPGSDGALDILDLSAGVPAEMTNSVPLPRSAADPRVGGYGSIALSPDGATAYLGSATRGDLFVVDLASRRVVRGADAPLELFPTPVGKNGLTSVGLIGDRLAVLDFNSDQLCLSSDLANQLTQRTCGSVGVQAEMLEGPLDLAAAPDGRLLVLMSIANALYRVDVSKTPFAIEHAFAKTGLSNNRVVVRGEHAYIVNSLSNNLQRVALASGATDLPFAVLPVKSNPFDLVITDEPEGAIAWVTLQGAHRVARIDLATGAVLSLLPEGAMDDSGRERGVRDSGPADEARACPEAGSPPVVGIGAVVQLTIGDSGGSGKEKLPGIIQGGPSGGGSSSTDDVLSLGKGGEIVVDFGDYDIVDGPGPDFIVFENPFLISPYNPFAEPAIVGVSATDSASSSFVDFPCDLSVTQGDPAKQLWPYPASAAAPSTPGCAGVRPVLANVQQCVSASDPAVAGGDAFDLATVGLKQARLLRLRDAKLSTVGGTGTAGFDLDAVVLIHYKKRR